MYATMSYICGMKRIITSFLVTLFVTFLSAQTANDIVLEAAKSKMGEKVWSGICFDLIDFSLQHVDTKWHKRSSTKFIYGHKIVKDSIIPGDIIVYKGCKFKDGTKALSHIAIVYFVTDEDKDNIEVLEQNYNAKSLKESRVVINDMNLSEDNLVQGKIYFYRPY